MKDFLRRVIAYLSQYTRASDEELVLALVLNTAQLALKKDEYVEFAAIKGTCGTFKLSGNSLPSFHYTVFEKKLMEFVEINVQVSRPNRITFSSRIKSEDKVQDGKEVETKDKYKEPFLTLTQHLFNYFPFPMEGGRKMKTEKKDLHATEIQVQNSNSA